MAERRQSAPLDKVHEVGVLTVLRPHGGVRTPPLAVAAPSCSGPSSTVRHQVGFGLVIRTWVEQTFAEPLRDSDRDRVADQLPAVSPTLLVGRGFRQCPILVEALKLLGVSDRRGDDSVSCGVAGNPDSRRRGNAKS